MPIALLNYTGKQLIPAYNPEDAKPISVNFAPNLIIAQGQVVGQITAGTADDVQTLTIVATGGTFTLALRGVDRHTYATAALAFDISAANLAIALMALAETAGYHLATAAVTLANGVYTITWGGAVAGYAMPALTVTSALTDTADGVTAAASIAHTTTGKTMGKFTAYNANNTDGSQYPLGVAPANFETDALGRVTYGNVPLLPPYFTYDRSVPVYILGFFFTQDLQGLDANAVSLLGRLVCGTVADGVLYIR